MLSRAALLAGVLALLAAAPAVARVPPVAAIAGPATAKVGATVTFDGSSSTKDTGRSIEQFAWDLDGDGTFETRRTTPRVSTSFDTPGQRQIGLRVTDSEGATSVAIGSILVEAPVVPAAPTGEPPVEPTPDPGPATGSPAILGGAPELGIAPLDRAAQEWIAVGSTRRFAALSGAARRRTGAVRAKGLWLNLISDRPARFELSVYVSRRDARRLRLPGRRVGSRVAVGHVVTRLPRAGQRPHRLVLPARVRRRLRAPLTLLVRGAATDAAGRRALVSRAFALRG